MARGRRCAVGCETWPDDDRFVICPVCGEPTKQHRGVEPIEQSEANRYLFEQFYKEWDKRPKVRLQETPEEKLRWDALYPGGRTDNAD